MQITNGTVEYARTVRPADFESKSFKVTLSFSIADGEDEAGVVERVGNMAVAETHHRLGLHGPAYAQRIAEQDAKPVQEETTKGKARSRKAGNAPETVAPATAPVQQPSTASSTTSEPDPTDDTGEDATVTQTSPPENAPTAWSDVDLNKLLERRRKEGITALQLREAINSFAPRMSQIPQDKRAAFVGIIESLPVQGKAPAAE